MRKPMIIAGIATAAVLVAGGGAAMTAANAEPTPSATTSDAPGDHGAAKAAPKVLSSQAEKTALEQVPAGWVTSAELETEHGRRTWQIEVKGGDGGEREFAVDAETGSLVTGKPDDDHRDDASRHDAEDDD
ncbi:PepSY domain-containing protein [Streptosporangium sp. NPDC000239]|uniref:PepSY domain-containing protein n=1 Tax=Streptosporangium sp. NPDC000239 TaxID=3154248 RepID=UPI0033343A4B